MRRVGQDAVGLLKQRHRLLPAIAVGAHRALEHLLDLLRLLVGRQERLMQPQIQQLLWEHMQHRLDEVQPVAEHFARPPVAADVLQLAEDLDNLLHRPARRLPSGIAPAGVPSQLILSPVGWAGQPRRDVAGGVTAAILAGAEYPAYDVDALLVFLQFFFVALFLRFFLVILVLLKTGSIAPRRSAAARPAP